MSFSSMNHVNYPDSKVYGANMGPTWGRQDPGGPHVVPMNFAIWECKKKKLITHRGLVPNLLTPLKWDKTFDNYLHPIFCVGRNNTYML